MRNLLRAFVFLGGLFAGVGLFGDEKPENWNWLLRSTYSYAELSPNGRYLLMYREIPYDPSEDRSPLRKEGRLYVPVSEYLTRAFLWDLQTGNIVLAGPPDTPGAGQTARDEVIDTRWLEDNTLLVVTDSEFHVVNPETGEPLRTVNRIGALSEASPGSLPASLDEPMLYHQGKWEQGRQTLLWSYLPSKRKAKRLPTSETVRDLVVRPFEHSDRNAYSVFTASKEISTGYTYSLEEDGSFQVYPMSLPSEWMVDSYSRNVLGDGELLVFRFLESGEHFYEAKLYDFRTNSLGLGSLLLSSSATDEYRNLVDRKVIDELRKAKGPLALDDLADPVLVKVLEDLDKAFPHGSFLLQEPEQNEDRLLVRVNSANRPLAWYLFDKKSKKLVKLLEGYPNLVEVDKGNEWLASFSASEESMGRSRVGLLEAGLGGGESEALGTIVFLESDVSGDFRFDRYLRYLASEGYNVVSLFLPKRIQLATMRAEGAEAFQAGQELSRQYLEGALATVAQERPEFLSEPGKVHFCFYGEAGGVFPSLPQSKSGSWGSAFLLDPRFATGLADMSFARIGTARAYPFDPFFDAETWVERAGEMEFPAIGRCVVVGRENNRQDFSTTEQVRAFEEYCAGRGMKVEVNRFDWSEYRVLPEWKRWGSIVVAIADTLKNRDSGFDRVKRFR